MYGIGVGAAEQWGLTDLVYARSISDAGSDLRNHLTRRTVLAHLFVLLALEARIRAQNQTS